MAFHYYRFHRVDSSFFKDRCLEGVYDFRVVRLKALNLLSSLIGRSSCLVDSYCGTIGLMFF